MQEFQAQICKDMAVAQNTHAKDVKKVIDEEEFDRSEDDTKIRANSRLMVGLDALKDFCKRTGSTILT